MLYQNQRTYELIVGDSTTGEAVVIVPPINLRFKIEKRLDNSNNLNNASFEIFNLSQTTRTKFENIKYPYIEFRCGYEDLGNLSTIFIGNATGVSSEQKDGEVITKIEALEGFSQLYSVLDPFVVPQSKPIYEVVLGVVKQMKSVVFATSASNLAITYRDKINQSGKKISEKVLEKKLNEAYSVDGTPFQVFNQVARDLNIQWRLERNILSFRNKGGKFSSPEQEVVLLSQDTGMVGLPSYKNKRGGVSDKEDVGMVGVEVTALLNPNLFPESLISIKSEVTQISGVYVVRMVEYDGEYNGARWYMKINADEISKNE